MCRARSVIPSCFRRSNGRLEEPGNNTQWTWNWLYRWTPLLKHPSRVKKLQAEERRPLRQRVATTAPLLLPPTLHWRGLHLDADGHEMDRDEQNEEGEGNGGVLGPTQSLRSPHRYR